MKGLKTLIRIQKQQLDEKRKALAAAETQKIKLERALETAQKELAREQQLVEQQPDMAFSFTGFAEANQKKQQNLAAAIQQKDVEIHTLEEGIHVLFSDLKKYDIALDQAEKKQAEEEKRRETIQFNDIAQENFRRQQDDSH